MIVQKIKAWLNKLFAWWPWKRASTPQYPQATSPMSKSMTQEQMWQTVREGPMPQSGVRSVVVEHEAVPNRPEPQSLDEFPKRIPPPAKHDEGSTPPCSLPSMIGKDKDILPEDRQASLSGYEQQLEFLRYLVQQGVINEGFAKGQVPTQYQSKREE